MLKNIKQNKKMSTLEFNYLIGNHSGSLKSFAYNFTVFLVLFLTLLFANFAEAIAEARGKAQADSLRKTREETPARQVLPNQEK